MLALNQLIGFGAASGESDPYWANVVLLAHCDGADASTTFTDNSPANNTLTPTGTARVSTGTVKYGTGALWYTASPSGRLQITDNANIRLGNGDFTIEFWVNFTAVNVEQCLIDKGWQSASPYASYLIYLNTANSGSLRFMASSSGGSWDIANERVIQNSVGTGAWKHIAVTRSGSTFRAFVDGVLQSGFTFTSSSTLYASSNQNLGIGARAALSDDQVRGYMDDIRITKACRYTADFTPPTAAFPNQ